MNERNFNFSEVILGFACPKDMARQIIAESKNLLKAEGGFIKGIRLLGLTVSNFIQEEVKKPLQLVIEF